MKKYFFEVSKTQLEKPTEPKYIFCSTAKTYVTAKNENDAKALAEKKLGEEFYGSGTGLFNLRLVKTVDLPTDWNYGYGDDRKPGTAGAMAELNAQSVIR